MKKILAIALLGLFAIVSLANAVDYDGLIKKTVKQNPDGSTVLPYDKVSLDSKGQLVGRTSQEGIVTKDTKVAMGKFNEQQKTWETAAPIPGGVGADIFKNAPTTNLQVLVRLTDDRETIQEILVKRVGGELVQAGPDFDGIIKVVGPSSMAVSHVELDNQWHVLKTFGIRGASVRADTVIAMGKYNDQQKKWEAGDPIEGGLKNDMFKDPGKKTIYAHFISRDDKLGVTHILITRIGAPEGGITKGGVPDDGIKPESDPAAKPPHDYDGIVRDVTRGGIAVVHVDVDDQFNILKKYGVKAVPVGADTVIAMGRYNVQEKKWEPGDPIEGGLRNEMFKDPGKQTIFAHFINRGDNRGVTHVLIMKIGAPVKK